jgi:uncharacterized protein
MAENLRLRIQEDMKDAMRSHQATRLGTIRLLLAAIKQREIDERITLDDAQVVAVITKMIKQRNDSIEQYKAGNRQDLADKEAAEIVVLKEYLPEPLTDIEIEELVKQTITEIGATSIKDMAKVMAAVKTKSQGRADMAKVSILVKTFLG